MFFSAMGSITTAALTPIRAPKWWRLLVANLRSTLSRMTRQPWRISSDDQRLSKRLIRCARLPNRKRGECYLWGPASVGKSHLLQAVCHQMGNDALYLPLDELIDIPPEALLEGAETVPLLALDNIQAVLPHPDWQAQLFHVFNRRRDAGHGQLFSADRAPSELTTLLPDLRSRLTSVTIFQLPKQSEQELADMLQFRAARRGLLLSDEVVHYILARAERSAVALIELLVRLDKAALASARAGDNTLDKRA